MSIVAVLLAVVAIVVSFAIPGPTGPTGPAGANGADGATGLQGPAGPAGAGTLMASNESGVTFINIGSGLSGCTNGGTSVNITVPRAGTIVVQGSTRLRINHVTGTEDRWLVTVGANATDCPTSAWSWLDSIGTNEPTQAQYWKSAYAQNVFTVTAAGTYTYYLNAYMVTGQDANDVFIYVNMVAVFYPS